MRNLIRYLEVVGHGRLLDVRRGQIARYYATLIILSTLNISKPGVDFNELLLGLEAVAR